MPTDPVHARYFREPNTELEDDDQAEHSSRAGRMVVAAIEVERVITECTEVIRFELSRARPRVRAIFSFFFFQTIIGSDNLA